MSIEEETAGSFVFEVDPLPFRRDSGGAIRIGQSRVSLDLIVEQYENGMTPEALVSAYDRLTLADVHAAIAFYLRHPDQVRAYLKQREEESKALRAGIEATQPVISRKALLTRRNDPEKGHVTDGE